MTTATAPPDLRHALRAERVRLHRATIASSAGASALLAAALVALMWSSSHRPFLLAWLGAVALALVLRRAVGAWQDRAAPGPEDSARWLLRYRAAFAVHGLVWSVLGAYLLPLADENQVTLLMFAVGAVAAGALVITAFDLWAAGVFAAPAALPLVDYIARRPDTDVAGLVLVAAMLGAITMLAALRADRSLRDNVALRIAETLRARQARQDAEAADQARLALAEQHHLLRQLMQTTEQGYWFVDVEGVTLEANPAMCRLLGRPLEQVVGRRAHSFFEGDALKQLTRELEARRRGEPGDYDIGIRRPDGSSVYCHNTATPIYDTQGRRLGSVGIWTDITARRNAEVALHSYELVANSLNDPVSVVGEDLVYRMVNDAWCRTTRIARDQAIGRSMGDILPFAGTPERLRLLAECIQSREPRRLVAGVPLPHADDRLFETTYYPYADHSPGVRCVVIVTRDVTEQEASRRALAESAEYLARTLNATGDAIFASDATSPTEPVRFVNEQMLRMWGIPAGSAATLTPAQIMAYATPQFADPVAEGREVARIVADNAHSESRVLLRDGRVLLRRCIPADVAGRRVRVWSFRDITAEERALQLARASESEQRALLDAFPGYICALDDDRRYTYVNDRLAALIGKPVAQLVGRGIREVAGEDAWLEAEREFRRAQAGERAVAERHYPANAAHAALDLELTYVVGPQRGGRRLFYAFGQDVTARKQAERALITARDEAEHANRAKSQFLSQMSHELRTPLNAVLGLGQLLASDPRHPLPPQQQAFVREMLHGARHLLELINEVLDLGSIEAGRLAIEPADVPLAPLCEECLALLRPLARDGGVNLAEATAPALQHAVRADPLRLRQVVLNLLGNAIKYTPRGGSVMIECFEDGGLLQLGVRDTGPGLTAAQCERLFQPFERLDASRTAVEGTGIGLALSRRLVEAMGGTIGVESEPGVGSLFWLRLPRGHATAPGQAAAPALAAPLPLPAGERGRPTVLYIEDNPINVFIMEAMFERLPDLRLLSATRPAEGLLMARQERPGLVLLDMQLPEMDGLEVLGRLRERPETAAIPVVAVSANGMPAEVEAARAAGAASYLTKPIELDTLAATLRTLLRQPVTPGD